METKGVYIQNVHFPQELVEVLTKREIANQEKATYEEMQRAQTSRIEMEKAKGTADMQGQLASAQVNVEIEQNRASARQAEAQGEAAYVELTGKAEATRVEAIGLANAAATEALGVARHRLRGAEGSAGRDRDRAGGGGERGVGGSHHRRARGARHRRRRELRWAGGDALMARSAGSAARAPGGGTPRSKPTRGAGARHRAAARFSEVIGRERCAGC